MIQTVVIKLFQDVAVVEDYGGGIGSVLRVPIVLIAPTTADL